MRTKEENMAIAALVCAIVGFFCCAPCSIVALILGIIVLNKVMGGYRTMALVGIIVGGIGVLSNIVGSILSMTVFNDMFTSMFESLM